MEATYLNYLNEELSGIVLGSLGLKKFIATCLFIISAYSLGSDLKISADFKEGDIVSAETFNEIFDTIEKINRTVTTQDLFGTWSCDALTTRVTNAWTQEGLYYVVKDTQVNFSQSSSGSNPINTISTSSTSPFKREGALGFSGSFSGTFDVYKNKLFTKHSSDSGARIWDINFTSPTRFELTFLETSAESFPTDYASFLTCDSATPVPASPTSPSAINAQTAINISWTNASEGELGFNVYRKLDGDSNYSLLTTTTSTSYSDSDTNEGLTYFYYVVSYNENGESSKSKIVSATLDSIPPTIAAFSPEAGSNVNPNGEAPYAGQGAFQLSITFSEPIEVDCPNKNEPLPGMMQSCDGDSYALKVETAPQNFPFYFLESGTTVQFFTGKVNAGNGTYTVTLDASFIKDLNGNSMSEDLSWTFTSDN